MSSARPEAFVTAIGMTTAIGYDSRTSCASFRAGIKRLAELDYTEFFDDEENSNVQLIGCVADQHSIEAEEIGKMVVLASRGMRDVLTDSINSNRGDDPIGIHLVLPDYSLRSITDNDSEESEPEEETADERAARFVEACDKHLRNRLLAALGLEVNIKSWSVTFGGQVEFVSAMQAAIETLESGSVARSIVGGIDSLIEPASLEWAAHHHRLRTEDNANGFIPGEAAAFIQLEKHAVGGSRSQVGLNLATASRTDIGEPIPGSRLALSMRGAMDSGGDAPVGLVIGGLNGEFASANCWGHALTKLISDYPELSDAPIWHPAEAFGETGCASLGLSIGVAVNAFERNYSGCDVALAWTRTSNGDAGSVLLTANSGA